MNASECPSNNSPRQKASQRWKFLYRLRHALWYNRLRWVRTHWLKLQGMAIGERSKVDSVHATCPHVVKLGSQCCVEAGVDFQYFGPWCEAICIEFGDRVHISRNAHFNIQKSITVGNDVMIAAGCKFIDHDHGFSTREQPMTQQAIEAASIHIGDDVWVGANAIILKGVHIGSGSIVAAGSVVRNDIPENQIWAGVPAKFIKDRP